MEKEYKVVSANIYDPKKSLFKEKNDKASVTIIKCCQDDCPLRDVREECIDAGGALLRRGKCPYGQIERRDGYTIRAQKYSKFIKDNQEKYKDIPRLSYIRNDKIAFIGDYVFLPYPHIALNQTVPFIKHDLYFSPGNPFIKIEDWNISTVLNIVDFKPRAMTGGIIESYQKEVVPKFIEHLREESPDMFQKLIKQRPKYDKDPDYRGRKAYLKTLTPPVEWDVKDRKGNVEMHWLWDGEKAYTEDEWAYNKLLAKLPADSVKIEVIPSDDAVIVVSDISYVNENTEFAD